MIYAVRVYRKSERRAVLVEYGVSHAFMFEFVQPFSGSRGESLSHARSVGFKELRLRDAAPQIMDNDDAARKREFYRCGSQKRCLFCVWQS